MENVKRDDEKDHRISITRIEKKISDATDEYKVLKVKNKEKEQEIKLNVMKIKELKKQIPHNKLRPMRGFRKNSTGAALSSGSPPVYQNSRNSNTGRQNTEKRHATVVR